MPTPDFTAATWRKSSRSNGNGGNCVEVAHLRDAIGIRDSKAPHDGLLALTPTAYTAFLHTLRGNQP